MLCPAAEVSFATFLCADMTLFAGVSAEVSFASSIFGNSKYLIRKILNFKLRVHYSPVSLWDIFMWVQSARRETKKWFGLAQGFNLGIVVIELFRDHLGRLLAIGPLIRGT